MKPDAQAQSKPYFLSVQIPPSAEHVFSEASSHSLTIGISSQVFVPSPLYQGSITSKNVRPKAFFNIKLIPETLFTGTFMTTE